MKSVLEYLENVKTNNLIIDENGELSSEVTMVELLGKDSIVHIKFEDYDMSIYCEDELSLNVGDKIHFRINFDHIHVFDKNDQTIF